MNDRASTRVAPDRLEGRSSFVEAIRDLALRGLARMYVPEERLFVYRLRRTGADLVREGLSPRYTAIAAIGLAAGTREEVRAVLGDHTPRTLCERLSLDVGATQSVGDVALTLWAATATGYEARDELRGRIGALRPDEAAHPTVEVAWTLAALCVDADPTTGPLRQRIAARLAGSLELSEIFPHELGRERGLRSHVSCFADLVYPIHALSLHSRQSGDGVALDSALRAAAVICRSQGPDGQWWWHYDRRTGAVIEPYPVYAVHQDAMAPMALMALQETSGRDFQEPIARGLGWLQGSPELDGGTLIDHSAGVIWRKVARREPGKLTRAMQAAASRLSPGLRVPGIDAFLPARSVDHETRPYHLGWLLHALRTAGPTSGGGGH